VKHDRRFWIEIYRPCFRAVWSRRSFLRSSRKEIQKSRRVGLTAFASAFRLTSYKVLMLARHGLPRVH
jgi:hypothetical protein